MSAKKTKVRTAPVQNQSQTQETIKKQKFLEKTKITSLPKTVQDSIPYKYIFEDGIIETESGTFTKCYYLDDVNFQIASDDVQDSIFIAFEQLLNSFDEATKWQICIFNRTINKAKTMDDIRILPRQDGLNSYRQAMNNILYKKVLSGRNSIIQDKYLIVSIVDNNYEHAATRFSIIDNEIVSKSLSNIIHKPTRPLTASERVQLLRSIYNQNNPSFFVNTKDKKTGEKEFDLNAAIKKGIGSKDIIGPSGMTFKPNYFILGEDVYGKTLFLNSVAPTMTTEFLPDLTSLQCNLLISMTYVPVHQKKATTLIKNQLSSIDADIAGYEQKAQDRGTGFGYVPPELKKAQEEASKLLEETIGENQKLFYMTFVITVFGNDMDSLNENVKLVQSVADKHLCQFTPLTFQQEFGFNESLPLALDKLNCDRMYTTDTVSVFIPYTSQELNQKDAIFYGQNAITKHMIIYDRKKGNNFNSLIFGASGGGKSFTAKLEMINILLRDPTAEIIVIDPENEYLPMAEALRGQVINLAPGSKRYINPLDMSLNYGGDGDPVKVKADFIISMIEIMVGEGYKMDPISKSIVSRCANIIYKPYVEQLKDSGMESDPSQAPTLNDLYQTLLAQKEDQAQQIAGVLEVYSKGIFDTFAHRTNIATNRDKSRFTIYNIKELGGGQQDLGLFVCLNDIWNRAIENSKKGIYTFAYIDEFYLLLRSPSATQFLMMLWKRGRKFRLAPCGIMQNTEDLLNTQETRNILNNTSFIQMMGLERQDRLNLQEMLTLSDSQLDYITNPPKGHGLLYTNAICLPIDNEIEKDSKIFKLADTTYKNT